MICFSFIFDYLNLPQFVPTYTAVLYYHDTIIYVTTIKVNPKPCYNIYYVTRYIHTMT